MPAPDVLATMTATEAASKVPSLDLPPAEIPVEDAATLEAVFSRFAPSESQYMLDTLTGAMLRGDDEIDMEVIAKDLRRDTAEVTKAFKEVSAVYAKQMVNHLQANGIKDAQHFNAVLGTTREGRIAYGTALRQAAHANNPAPWSKAIVVYMSMSADLERQDAGRQKADIDAALAREGKAIRGGKVVSLDDARAYDYNRAYGPGASEPDVELIARTRAGRR